MTKRWWKTGVRFQCQGSGKCCVSRGQYGFAYLTLEDRRRLAAHLAISTRAFTARYCDKTDGFFHLKNAEDSASCVFLDGKQCGVYSARPTQCRTWPFWPEVMGAKQWSQEVSNFCPGVGKGRIWSKEEIEEQLDRQKKSDQALNQEAR